MTVWQLPLEHDWHVPVQAVPQQVLSLQIPLAHSPTAAQLWPFFFLQAPAGSQVLLPLHVSESSVLVTLVQLPVAQFWQAAVHALPQHTLSLQKLLAHSAAAAQP